MLEIAAESPASGARFVGLFSPEGTYGLSKLSKFGAVSPILFNNFRAKRFLSKKLMESSICSFLLRAFLITVIISLKSFITSDADIPCNDQQIYLSGDSRVSKKTKHGISFISRLINFANL